MARSQGAGGWGIATALLGIGFFIALVLAIVFYTQVGAARVEADEARTALDEFVNASQRGSAQVAEVRGSLERGQTIFGSLIEENQSLKSRISAGNDSLDAIEQKLASAQVEGSLLAALQTTRAELDAISEQLEDANAARDQARAQTRAAEAARDQARQEFTAAEQELQGKVDQLAAQVAAQSDRVTGVETSASQQLSDVRGGLQEQLTAAQAENQQLTRRVRELEDQLTVVNIVGDVAPPQTEPDGEIVAISGDARTVFINLGANDRIRPGITFEVFPADELIKLDDIEAQRGLATIEVYSVDDSSASARVVRADRGARVRPGDAIVNLIYSSQLEPKLYVYGDFDLTGDGATTQDRRRIESLVERYGGALATGLGPDVDFLVLGVPPALPDAISPSETDLTKIRENVEATKRYEDYQTLISDARQLSIPVLNQNRFLDLVGYYRR